MREQGSLKGQGTHRGNLCVHIFKQILTLKDIQRKKSKQEIYSFFLLSENTSGGPKVIPVKAVRSRSCLSRDHMSMGVSGKRKRRRKRTRRGELKM